ncbi:138_t:CDS:10 [Funneliformis geosporum]|uniref:7769_t:CDS:1 n=1 Tax=Funneliformis geosporum TaxID=1117311 RepID=A0A9W4SRI1_9GLOM|nr:7769_t:CDS:10 [Funneliformis geosporum]CAI2183426.1 138_t:CDS:10 [Funneliformis geosporum]
MDLTNIHENLQGDGIVTMQPVSVEQMQPTYAAEFPIQDDHHGFYGGMINLLGATCGFIGSIPICPCFPNPYKKVEQGYVGLISRFGKFYKFVDPGLVKVNVFTETIHRVDVKIQITEIPHQFIMTKDNVYVQIDSIIYWHVVSPYQSTFGIADVRKALIERTQTTLRHILGTRVLQEFIENREAIAYEIKEIIDKPASNWGVKVESILIKDIVFSKELQESLSSAAQQKRIGESKVIAAQAEVDAAKLMRQAAELLNSPAAMQIRYLETMSSMSKASGTKVIFMPYSTDGSVSGSSGNKIDPVTASAYQQISEQK